MRGRVITTLCVGLTILTAGCELQSEGGLTPTAPSALAGLLLGNWTSAPSTPGAPPPAGFPSAAACTDLEWSISDQMGSTYTGEFAATCSGGVQLTGTATGTLVDDVLTVDATGTATLLGQASCPFTLSGTAHREAELIRIVYTGESCLGPISGEELLERE